MAKKEKLDLNKIETDSYDNSDVDETEEFEELSIDERLNNIEKKVTIVLVISIATIFFSLCSMIYIINGNNNSYDDTNTQEEYDESDYTYDTSDLEEIKATDIKKLSDDETIVVVIARQGCSFCAQYIPVLTKIADSHNVKVKYIDFAKIIDFTQSTATISDNEAYETLSNLKGVGDWEDFAEVAIQGTPNTLFIKDNKIISGVNGNQSEDVIEQAFKEAGLA